MDPARAQELLSAERARIEKGIADAKAGGPESADDRVEPGDRGSENLYQDEFDAGSVQDFEAQLAAVDRAEQRLGEGTYGVSIESGETIPDARLEANPTAERTTEEAERRRSGH